MAEGDWSQMEI